MSIPRRYRTFFRGCEREIVAQVDAVVFLESVEGVELASLRQEERKDLDDTLLLLERDRADRVAVTAARKAAERKRR